MESLFYGTSEIFRVLVNYTRDISIFIIIKEGLVRDFLADKITEVHNSKYNRSDL